MTARHFFLPLLLASTLAAAAARPQTESAATAPAHEAQPASAVVLPGSRVLKTFDFEETKVNFEDLPMFWQKVVGRGYPVYSAGKFDRTVARSADTSFRLDLDGGSVAYRLMADKIPINPAADYYIVGWVKTTPTRHAKPEITAWFADEAGNLLPNTECHAAASSVDAASAESPADTPATTSAWRPLQLFIPGSDLPAAKSLVLQIGLLQPQQLTPGPLGKFELYQQDLKGSAWFDDIVVFQLPRVSIATEATANVFSPNRKVAFNLTVSDLGHAGLEAAVTIYDADRKPLRRETFQVPAEVIADGRTWVKHLECPTLPPGLYTATLDVIDTAHKAPNTRRQLQFLTAAPIAASARNFAAEFGLDASAWPVEAWDQLPYLLTYTGSGLIALPAWRRDMSEEALLRRDPQFDTLMLALLKTDTRILASFGEVPVALNAKLAEKKALASNDDSILALLDADPTLWRPYTSFVLARYANRVDFWQLGRPADTFYSADPRYPKVYARTRGELAGMLSTPKLVIPWSALYEFDPAAYPAAMLNLQLPSAIGPAQIPTYLHSFVVQTSAPDLLVHITPLDNHYTRVDRLSDFAKRVIYSRTVNPRAILVDLPMTRRVELFSQTSQPTELLLVYRTLISQLGSARFVREFSPAPGVHAFLFDRSGEGTLAVFSDTPATVSLALGKAPAKVDLWGNATPLAVNKGVATVNVSSTPLFLSNIDAHLVELRASFALETSKFPAGAGTVQTVVHLHNPYTTALVGNLHLVPPPGWTFDPPSVQLNLAPNGQLSAPVTVTYPYNEPAGAKQIGARLTSDALESEPIALSFQAAVTSELVDVECYALLEADGKLVLQQMITNISSQPIDAQAYALVPGQARQQRYVLDLKPGESTIKRFAFTLPGDPAAYVGKAASVGLRQNDGKTLYTKSVTIE
jgi:hypothetical protein